MKGKVNILTILLLVVLAIAWCLSASYENAGSKTLTDTGIFRIEEDGQATLFVSDGSILYLTREGYIPLELSLILYQKGIREEQVFFIIDSDCGCTNISFLDPEKDRLFLELRDQFEKGLIPKDI